MGDVTIRLQDDRGVNHDLDATEDGGVVRQRVDVPDGVALQAGMAKVGSVIADPPSQGPGRTHVQAASEVSTGDTQVCEVTEGKTLHITSMSVVVHSQSAVTGGTLNLTDGVGGDLLMSVPVPASVDATSTISLSLTDPMRVTDSLEAVEAAGSIRYGISVVGYED